MSLVDLRKMELHKREDVIPDRDKHLLQQREIRLDVVIKKYLFDLRESSHRDGGRGSD